MKPHRIRMTHNLLLNYGLYRKMEIYRPHKATQEEMTKFHSDDYIRFLRSIRPDNMGEYNKQMQRYKNFFQIQLVSNQGAKSPNKSICKSTSKSDFASKSTNLALE